MTGQTSRRSNLYQLQFTHYQISYGVEHVLVNGIPIIEADQPVTNVERPLPGRSLTFKEE